MAEPEERDELEEQDEDFGERMPSRDESQDEGNEQSSDEQSRDEQSQSQRDSDDSWVDKATDFGKGELKKRL